jgi:hypothetical protein
MSLRSTRDQLKIQILETERLVESLADHPVMSYSFQKRLEQLKNQLAELPISAKEPTVTLQFSGKPVHGSVGIDANFLGKVLLPFQKMVHADLVQRGYGKVGNRGQLKSAEDARLFLTALPRGSFGVELSKMDSGKSFDEDQVSDSLAHISKLIDSSAKSDEDFASTLDDVSARTLQGLRQFLKIVSEDEAGLIIESGGIRSSLDAQEVINAYHRVAETVTKQEEVEVKGVLKGILLESWRFDFVTDHQQTITGTLGAELAEKQVADFAALFFNKPCTALLQKTIVVLKSGRIKESFSLKDISDL